MLKKIDIKNFQSHQDTQIELHPGINIILGSSDAGKSAFLRSIYWLNENRPLGTDFVSWWTLNKKGKPTAETHVTVETEEGNIITRLRDPEKNQYIVNKKEYEALKTEMPAIVSKTLNLSEVNFSKQHDPPFLISESSGEVSRFLNRIIHLDIIDNVLMVAESDRRKTKQKTEQIEEEITVLEKQIKELSWIENAEILVDKVNNFQARITKRKGQKEKLSIDISSLLRLIEGIKKYEKINKAEHTFKLLQEKTKNRNENDAKHANLNKDISTYFSHKRTIEKNERIKEVETVFNDLKKVYERLQKNNKKHTNLSISIFDMDKHIKIINKYDLTKIISITERIQIIYNKISKSTQNKNELLKTIQLQKEIKEYTINIESLEKMLPTICPLCKEPRKNKDHEHG